MKLKQQSGWLFLGFGLAWLFIGTIIAAGAASAAGIVVDPQGARLSLISIEGKALDLAPAGGGFRIYDATAKEEVTFPTGTLNKSADKTVYTCEASGLRLNAEFVSKGDHVLVAGEVENLQKKDRGILLDYCVPLAGTDLSFANALDQSLPIAAETVEEGNAVPIAALCGKTQGVALAIPPSEPRIFGMEGSAKGLTVRFYLGLSPDTANFPNRASFSFIIYGVDPAWGFRSALARYFALYPERYKRRVECHGMWLAELEGRTPQNIDQFGFDMLEMLEVTTKEDVARDTKYGLLTYPYTLVGQREIKYLDKLPENDEEAMAAYAKWSYDDIAGRPLVKENTASRGDINLKAEVDSSACVGPDGKYCLTLRNTFWGGNSVTFTVNPNPDLFKDTNKPTVGGEALKLVQEWLGKYPEIDGIFVDSLGPRWPAVLNYRKDHFRYARYPLTVDPDGRVALHNQLSHYEFLERLLETLPPEKRSLAVNGIKGTYLSRVAGTYRKFPEHYRREVTLDRFFMASLVDIAGGENGVSATSERCREIRTVMYDKPYAFLNYHWEDPEAVAAYFNRCLAYAIFATNSRNPFEAKDYQSDPQGYARDKELIDWFIPLARTLSKAGWRPVTHATTNCENVFFERFGEGDAVYITVFSENEGDVACTLDFDLEGLGFTPEQCAIKEIARDTPLHVDKRGGVTLTAEPLKCYIIAITR